jgi:hypothetical protein
MAHLNVVELPSTSKPRQTVRKNTRAARALRRQTFAAGALGLVALTLTGLSLSHLASGIAAITGCECWEGWSMAIGIDLGFVALELLQLMVGDRVRRQIAGYSKPAILGTLSGSAILNALAFSSHAANVYFLAGGIAFGIAIPAAIYCFVRVAAIVAKDCHTRQ